MTNDEFSVPDTPEGLESSGTSPLEEPSAGWRQSATTARQFYISLIHAGFSTAEALELVKVVIRTAAEQGFRGNGHG